MKVTAIGIVPPATAKDNPAVTPELLASCLARYSRSTSGIEQILSSVDLNDPDKSIDSIFKFIDYGHASIGGLTGGIAIAVDGCSLLLAYKIFEIAQLCDGQESSTRYIQYQPDSLLSPSEIGIPQSLATRWTQTMELALAEYHSLYNLLDDQAHRTPQVVRYPKNATPKVIERIKKNYALDRSRYFIPAATRNNAAYIMTARVWAHTIRQLDALPWSEARRCATLLRQELTKFAPRLVSHSHRDEASVAQQISELDYGRQWIKSHGVSIENLPDEVFVSIDDGMPPFIPTHQTLAQAFQGKSNRYSWVGERIRRTTVRFALNNISFIELRDLNRHRSGCRYSPLTPVGFYLPPEIPAGSAHDVLQRLAALTMECVALDENFVYPYRYLAGTQLPFEHSTHLDKLIYEIELRTGLGAHVRYAEHMTQVCNRLLELRPELRPYIELGAAEPE